jgi:hypothetical protein
MYDLSNERALQEQLKAEARILSERHCAVSSMLESSLARMRQTQTVSCMKQHVASSANHWLTTAAAFAHVSFRFC